MPYQKILRLFVIFLVGYETIAYLSNDMYLPALPDIIDDLQISHQSAQMTLTMWFLGSASVQLILGPISDRYGRRPVLLWGGVFFIISSLVCALSPDITTMLIGRFFQGLTVSSVVVAGYASIHELFEQKEAISVLAWMNGITVLAPAFGPLLGGFMLYFSGWRFIFALLAVCACLFVSALYKIMPESNPEGKTQHSLHLGRLLRSYGAILTNLGFVVNTAAFCLFFSGMIAWIAAGPFLVIDEYKYDVLMFGVFQILIFGSYILGTKIVQLLILRMEISTLTHIGLTTVLFASLLGLCNMWLFPNSLIGLIIALMIFAYGAGLIFAILQRLAIEASQQPMGLKIAVFSCAMSTAGVLGSGMVSFFYNGTLVSLGAYVFIAGIVGCLIRWLMPHKMVTSRSC